MEDDLRQGKGGWGFIQGRYAADAEGTGAGVDAAAGGPVGRTVETGIAVGAREDLAKIADDTMAATRKLLSIEKTASAGNVTVSHTRVMQCATTATDRLRVIKTRVSGSGVAEWMARGESSQVGEF